MLIFCHLQATVYLLEKLDVILAKASEDEIKSNILPMIFSTLESNSIQGQVYAVHGLIHSYLHYHHRRRRLSMSYSQKAGLAVQ